MKFLELSWHQVNPNIFMENFRGIFVFFQVIFEYSNSTESLDIEVLKVLILKNVMTVLLLYMIADYSESL